MRQEETELRLGGMYCQACTEKIRGALEALPRVHSATVDLQAARALIVHEANVEPRELVQAVRSAGDYSAAVVGAPGEDGGAGAAGERRRASAEPDGESLYPLILIVAYILGVTLIIAYATGSWALEPLMRHFMTGFFLTFSFFKLLDLRGFVDAYRDYDLIARAVPIWGWAYPFVELALGAAYLLAYAPVVVNAATLVLMLVGAAGVMRALLDRRAIRCACLGTALNLPMTTVTLVEDLTMAAMAGGMLLLRLS